MKMIARAVAVLSCAAALCMSTGPSFAQSTGATVTATVLDVNSGLPVAGASVELYRGEQRVAGALTGNDGTAAFPNEAPAIYHIEIRAQGYGAGRSDDVAVPPGSSAAVIRTVLQRSSLSQSNLREIGRVSTAARGSSLQTSSAITGEISTERLQRQNYVRAGDALYVLPGVNLGSQDSAVGDDLQLNIRGIGQSDSQVLLDGHPIGPFGAGGESFNLQLTPFFGLRNVEVLYGSGAQGLLGVDAIGGAIDLQTLNPTRTPIAQFIQGFGNQGKLETGVQATGTLNRLGYAISSSVSGTYGQFAPGNRLQTGNLGGDYTPGNLAANTYPVSANYTLRDDLIKLTYALTPKTNASLAYYGAYSYDDKTGNGDNDANSYQGQYYALTNPAPDPGTLIPAPDGSTPCPAFAGLTTPAYPVPTASGVQCQTSAQYANATSGPAGGGQYRFQQDKDVDYTLRLNHQAGNHALSGVAYTDDYHIATTRTLSPSESRFTTFGFQLADDIVGERNTFGFGLTGERQRLNGNSLVAGTLVANPNLGQATTNYFVRDQYSFNPRLTAFVNVWAKNSSVTRQTTLDPRISLVGRPTANDVIRLTVARADDFPSIGITGNPVNFSNPNSVNVGTSCGTGGNPVSLGSAPGTNLQPERADDIELAVGHHFRADSQIEVSLYDSNVRNQILGNRFILTDVPQLLSNPQFVGYLSAYLAKFNSNCNQFKTSPILNAAQLAALTSVSTYANAASGRYQGIEINGRQRFAPRIYVDYAYDVQSAYRGGFSDNFLARNGNVVPGAQIGGIPLHKASLGLDVSDAHGLEFRMDGFYVGDNNGYQRPAYTFYNAALTKSMRNTTLNFGVQNLFNSASQDYGLFGLGTYAPYNSVYVARQAAQGNVGLAATGLAQGNERFGLAPRSFLFTVTQRVGGGR